MKKLGFGTMRLPLLNPEDPASIDFDCTAKMMDSFLAQGFTYFDTAYPYHQLRSETAVKECLVDRYPREAYQLADKMPILRVENTADYERFFEEQLAKTGVDYFDVYLLHNIGRDRYIKTEKFGGFPFVQRIKEQGMAKRIGFSYHDDAETLDRILTEHPEVDVVQLQVNYLDWEDQVAQSHACVEVAGKHGKSIIVMEPVKGGTLAELTPDAQKLFSDFYTEKDVVLPSPASLAIRFAASQAGVEMVLSGMSSLEQLADNTSYMKDFKPLSEEERDLCTRISDIIHASIAVPCTGCRYCTEKCPMNINIPGYFALLNMYATLGKKTNMYYERYSMNYGMAKDCIKCGLCEQACPQKIAVRDALVDFSNLYENK